MSSASISLKTESFGTINNKNVQKFIWENSSNNVRVEVMNYGATITKILVPDKNNKLADTVLGYDTASGYLAKNNPYFGATIGRVCNRIGNGTFKLEGKTYQLAKNASEHHLHGGNIGFDKVFWNYHINGKKVIMTYLSPDGDEGYPGDLLVTVIMELNANNEFIVEMLAMCTMPTIVNLTNHSYLNLAGHDTGVDEVKNHRVTINANQITETDCQSIPTGQLISVSNTPYDFQKGKLMKDAFESLPTGYDNNFCIPGNVNQNGPVATAYHVNSGRVLEVYSNQPGVQFYTSNYFPERNSTTEELGGKNNSKYYKHGAFCFETQIYPDAINHPNFPSPILIPGQQYYHKLVYKFSVRK